MAIRYSDDNTASSQTEELLSGVSQWLRGLYEQVVGAGDGEDGDGAGATSDDASADDADAGDTSTDVGEADGGSASTPSS